MTLGDGLNGGIEVRKAFLVLGMLLLMAGCSDDSTVEPEVETPDPLPETVHILVNDYVDALENMSDDALAHLIHEDFQFDILQSTRDDWGNSDFPLNSDYFDRVATLAAHANIFGGVEGMNEAGQVIGHVESVSVSVWDLVSAWEPISETDDFYQSHPGAFHARYNTLFHLYKTNYSRWEIDQTLDLVAIMVTDSEGVEGWQLLAVRGLYNSRVTENISYDSILSMYRF